MSPRNLSALRRRQWNRDIEHTAQGPTAKEVTASKEQRKVQYAGILALESVLFTTTVFTRQAGLPVTVRVCSETQIFMLSTIYTMLTNVRILN